MFFNLFSIRTMKVFLEVSFIELHDIAHGRVTKTHFVSMGWQILDPLACSPSQSD